MEEREIAEGVEKQPYFEAVTVTEESKQDDGTREMGELYPFLISGGTNTERYYFTHINDKTDYKFNIRPRYFGDESNYTEAFPKRINEVLSANNDAKIFCVFDWDTIYGDEAKLKKHEVFMEQIKEDISNGTVVLCPSMPSIEYWFLLHYKNTSRYYGTSQAVIEDLKNFIPQYDKAEKFLQQEKWVVEMTGEGRLEEACARAEALGTDGESYSKVFEVIKVIGKN